MDITDSRSADSQLSPQRVRIDLAERSYDILIGAGLLGREDSYEGLPAGGTAMIVTNTVVAPLYLDRLAATFSVPVAGARVRICASTSPTRR